MRISIRMETFIEHVGTISVPLIYMYYAHYIHIFCILQTIIEFTVSYMFEISTKIKSALEFPSSKWKDKLSLRLIN
jgi:hypothetical protein